MAGLKVCYTLLDWVGIASLCLSPIDCKYANAEVSNERHPPNRIENDTAPAEDGSFTGSVPPPILGDSIWMTCPEVFASLMPTSKLRASGRKSA